MKTYHVQLVHGDNDVQYSINRLFPAVLYLNLAMFLLKYLTLVYYVLAQVEPKTTGDWQHYLLILSYGLLLSLIEHILIMLYIYY